MGEGRADAFFGFIKDKKSICRVCGIKNKESKNNMRI